MKKTVDPAHGAAVPHSSALTEFLADSKGSDTSSNKRPPLGSRSGGFGAPKTEMVEIIARTEGMETTLTRLTDILQPYLTAHDFDEQVEIVSTCSLRVRYIDPDLSRCLAVSLSCLSAESETNNVLFPPSFLIRSKMMPRPHLKSEKGRCRLFIRIFLGFRRHSN